MTDLSHCKNNESKQIEIAQYLTGWTENAINVDIVVYDDSFGDFVHFSLDGCECSLSVDGDEIIEYVDDWAFDDFSLIFTQHHSVYDTKIEIPLMDMVRISEI